MKLFKFIKNNNIRDNTNTISACKKNQILQRQPVK